MGPPGCLLDSLSLTWTFLSLGLAHLLMLCCAVFCCSLLCCALLFCCSAMLYSVLLCSSVGLVSCLYSLFISEYTSTAFLGIFFKKHPKPSEGNHHVEITISNSHNHVEITVSNFILLPIGDASFFIDASPS